MALAGDLDEPAERFEHEPTHAPGVRMTGTQSWSIGSDGETDLALDDAEDEQG